MTRRHELGSEARHWVFAYGSNMCAGDLEAWFDESDCRGGQVSCVATAYLSDFELTWNYYSPARSAGAANVTPRHGAKVYGLVLDVDTRMLKALDTKEGHPQRYARQRQPVTLTARVDGWSAAEPRLELASAQAIDCWIYRVTPEFERSEPVPPSDAYLATVLGAARRFGFPAEYVEALQR